MEKTLTDNILNICKVVNNNVVQYIVDVCHPNEYSVHI